MLLVIRTNVRYPGAGTTLPTGRRRASGALRRGDWRVATPILAAQESGVVHTQPVSFPIRLPDALQAEALRLLDASRRAINEHLVNLWPALDRFAAERTGPAWKQVEQYAAKRSGHGSRQER